MSRRHSTPWAFHSPRFAPSLPLGLTPLPLDLSLTPFSSPLPLGLSLTRPLPLRLSLPPSDIARWLVYHFPHLLLAEDSSRDTPISVALKVSPI